MTPGQIARGHRKRAKLPPELIATTVGVSVSALYTWEQDRHVPSKAHAEALDEMLGAGGEAARLDRWRAKVHGLR